MIDITRKRTWFKSIKVGDLVVYTGNDRLTDKYLYKVHSVSKTYVILNNLCSLESLWSLPCDSNGSATVVLVKELTPGQIKATLSPVGFTEFKERTRDSEFTEYQEQAINTNKSEGIKMKTCATDLTKANVVASKAAAQHVAGKVLNKALLTKIRPQLPMLARGYADHALANVVVANIANFAVSNFASDNAKAKLAADAMMIAAMTEFLSSFNVEDIVAELLEGVTLPDSE